MSDIVALLCAYCKMQLVDEQIGTIKLIIGTASALLALVMITTAGLSAKSSVASNL